MMRVAALIFFILWLPCVASGAPERPEALPALPGGERFPVEVTADRLEADAAARRVRFVGSVVVRQGEITIRADVLTIVYAGAGDTIETVDARGQVRVERSGQVATGDQAVLFVEEGRVVLTGHPRIQQGDDWVEGESVTLFLNQERSIVEGRDESRVKAIFHPRGEEKP